MTEENQDALRRADELGRLANLEANDLADCMEDAAAHIRRLVAENEALREDLRKFREAASCERDLRQQQQRQATAPVPLTPIECVPPKDMASINWRLAYKQGWKDAERAHGITKGDAS